MEVAKRITRIIPIVLFAMLTLIGISFSLYLLFTTSALPYTHAIAILFLALSVISGFFNIFTSYSYYRSSFYDDYIDEISRNLKPLTRFPTVAIAVPVYNEDVKTVEKNLQRLREMRYPADKLNIYLLDDSTDRKINDELHSFAKRSGIRYMHRKSRKGFKAGALNNFIKHSSEEFVAIFDYDEYLTNTNFLMEILPYFGDDNVSYVQTEKRYFKGTFFSDTVDLFDAFFFKFIQPSRALNNTAIFAGSCGVIRRKALRRIGGFPEYVVEDTFFSLESDMHNYKSLYLPKVYAYGKPIMTFSDLAKQQFRYNYGDTQFLHYFMSKQNGSRRKMSALSKIDYITHGFGLNYISIALILFTLVSILIVYSSSPLAKVTIATVLHPTGLPIAIELLGGLTFALSILAPVLITKIHFKSVRKGLMVFFLNFALAIIRAKAVIAASLSLAPASAWDKAEGDMKKVATAARNSASEIVFSTALLALSMFAFVINNFSGALWLLWYSLLYASTFFFFYKYG